MALGIYAYHRGWFTKDALPKWRTFMVVAIVCILALQASNFIDGTTLAGYLVPLVNDFARFLKVMVFLCAFLGLAGHYMNRPSAFNANMTANSYNLYLLQYPVILACRLLFFSWEVSAFIKFTLVLGLTLIICHLLSQYVIRLYPRLAVAGLLLLHAVLCLFTFSTG